MGCFGGGDDEGETDQACTAFSSQAARDYCESDGSGDTLDCSDFATSNEATRFIQTIDTANENQLEQTGTAYCTGLAVAGTTPGSTAGPVPTATPEPAPTETPAPATYTVEPGDNPTLIAQSVGVPEDQVDAWVAELLALNDTEATALQVGQTLNLPPINGQGPGTVPANTGDPGAAPTNTPVTQAEPTATVPAAATTAPTTAAPTATNAAATATASATSSPGPTNTPGSGGTASFDIVQASATAGETINYEGTNFTPNAAITIELLYEGIFIGSESDEVGPEGTFSGAGQIPAEASQYPGTYTIRITDTAGKTASDSIEVQ